MFKALKVEFDSSGLKNFYLDFNAAIESKEDEKKEEEGKSEEEKKKEKEKREQEEKEDKKILKCLYDVVVNKHKTEYFLNELLYDLYNATLAYLKNKEFWNKMF